MMQFARFKRCREDSAGSPVGDRLAVLSRRASVNRRRAGLLITLAFTLAGTTGCGGGAAADDVARIAAKAVGEATPGERGIANAARSAVRKDISGPTTRVASASSVAETEATAQALASAFCEGWAFAQEYGGWPPPDQWLQVAKAQVASRGVSLVAPTLTAIDSAVGAFERTAAAYDAGDLTAASVEAFCGIS